MIAHKATATGKGTGGGEMAGIKWRGRNGSSQNIGLKDQDGEWVGWVGVGLGRMAIRMANGLGWAGWQMDWRVRNPLLARHMARQAGGGSPNRHGCPWLYYQSGLHLHISPS